MLKIFTSIEALLWEVQADRHIEGDGASTANRFPVRFVLFDNFRDCCTFVDDCLHLPNIAIQRIDDWMDCEFSSYTFNPMYYAKNFYCKDSNNEWIFDE